VQHGHSLWGLVWLLDMLEQRAVTGWQTTLYAVAAAIIFLALAVHVVLRETERWKRVLLAMLPALLLPYVSADYTLIWLYFPLVFFLNAPRISRWDVSYVALFGLLLVPVDYYYIAGDVSISAIVYPVAMLALLLLAILDRQGAAGAVQGEAQGPQTGTELREVDAPEERSRSTRRRAGKAPSRRISAHSPEGP